jgi:preprotein translocase subunit YajC
MNWFITEAVAQTAPAEAAPKAFDPSGILLLVGMFAVFYFLLIRPQQKRAKEHKAMVDALAKGDEVVAAGGVLGRVTHLAEGFVTLEIADKVEIKVQRAAVQTVLPKGTLKSVD